MLTGEVLKRVFISEWISSGNFKKKHVRVGEVVVNGRAH